MLGALLFGSRCNQRNWWLSKLRSFAAVGKEKMEVTITFSSILLLEAQVNDLTATSQAMVTRDVNDRWINWRVKTNIEKVKETAIEAVRRRIICGS